ncbi:hypothetical protein L596_030544 [Steinernema carpocapsae]|uniref:Uncharacterized protein n=1 Tax=Steinernema carpocapsae TaxID=34508 RepID=A0A4U5LPN7_STECR|nr:hypothetical protein L596_030544 [Steinernema carpocapsae]
MPHPLKSGISARIMQSGYVISKVSICYTSCLSSRANLFPNRTPAGRARSVGSFVLFVDTLTIHASTQSNNYAPVRHKQ